jgi:hypothetical protein
MIKKLKEKGSRGNPLLASYLKNVAGKPIT